MNLLQALRGGKKKMAWILFWSCDCKDVKMWKDCSKKKCHRFENGVTEKLY